MKLLYPALPLLLLLFCTNAQSQSQLTELHNFISYDTTYNLGYGGYSYILHITRPANSDTALRPALIAMNTDQEVGSADLTARYGPGYWLANGWDGSVQLGNGKHYPIIITVQPNKAWPQTVELENVMNYILNTYHIKRNAVHLCGIGMGASSWASLICHQYSPSSEDGMKMVTSLLCLQGQSNAVSSNYVVTELPGYTSFGHWAKKYHGKFLGLEGSADTSRCVWLLSQNMNDSVPGSAYFSYENLGSGTYSSWNSMYQPTATNWTSVGTLGPNNVSSPFGKNAMGTYTAASNLFQWMLRQGDTSLVVTANAGVNQTIALPASSVTLNGTSSLGSTVSYSWKLMSGPNTPVIVTPSSATSSVTGLIPGTYIFTMNVTSLSSILATANVTVTVNAGAVPGKIEAESYNTMSGVSTQTTTDAGAGLNVGWIDNSDWMDYKVNIATAGLYLVSFRVATATAGATFQLRSTTGLVFTSVNLPNTGGTQNWQTITAAVTLPAGAITLQLFSTSTANWNINWMQFDLMSVAVIPGKIEAEYYSDMSGVQTQATTDIGGGMNVGWINQGDWMDYAVTVAVAGTYTASFRISTGTAGASLQLKQANGTVLATVALPNTGSVNTWQTVNTAVTLPAGTQTLRLYSSSTTGWNINWMQFTDPTLAVIPGKVEAETYNSMSGVALEATTDVGAGADVGWINQGDWMNYNVTVSTAGTYTANFRIATAAAGASFQVKQANGTVLATVALPNTGGVQAWQTVGATVTLPAGNQTLQLYSTSSAGWNINWMDFENTSGESTTGEQSAVSVPGKIETENYNTMSGVEAQTTTDDGGGLNMGWIDQGDWMNYNVNATAAGAYTASFRVACPYTGAAFQLRGTNGTILATINVPNTGDFQNWQTISATVTLPAGKQTLQLYSVSSLSWNINWMQFSVLGAAAIPGKIEAENYTTMSGVGTEVSADAGGTMDVGWINQGDWMNYNVNVAAAGTYTANFRVATASTGASFQLKSASGAVLATVNVPNTGGAQNWQTVSATVTLTAGSQTLQLSSTSAAGWNINWVQFASGATTLATTVMSSDLKPSTDTDSSAITDPSAVSSSFTLYPNPFTDHITVQINNGYTGPMSVQIINVSGQLLKTYNSTKDQPYAQVNLPVGNLPAGIYFVRVQIGSNWNIIKKVIKQ